MIVSLEDYKLLSKARWEVLEKMKLSVIPVHMTMTITFPHVSLSALTNVEGLSYGLVLNSDYVGGGKFLFAWPKVCKSLELAVHHDRCWTTERTTRQNSAGAGSSP